MNLRLEPPIVANARPTYLRGSLSCYMDRCRGYLVAATPEEAVRQDVLDWLIDELGYPAGRLRSEFNQRRRGGDGRADLIVLAPGAADEAGEVLMVVECKRPGTFLDDRVVDQAVRYATHLEAALIVVTNGDEFRTYAFDEHGWIQHERVPAWNDLLVRDYGDCVDVPPFARWDWSDIATVELASATAANQGLVGWIVGEDSAPSMMPFALNLFGLLADGHDRPVLPFTSGDVLILEDLGQRSRTFANSAGGAWPSDYYRSFLAYEHARSAHQVVSLAVFAQARVTAHPTWGNRRGTTVLVAAVDEGPTSHAGLNMALDRAVDLSSPTDLVEVTHDASMTTGKRGAERREVVLDGLMRHGSSDLVRGRSVVLGTLPRCRKMTWNDAQTFVGKVIRYSLVRDRIRAERR